LLITALALAVPLATSRLRRFQLPFVVGEILAGILIGRSGLNLVESSPTLDFLKEFGFAFLMFLSGLELDFNLMTGRTVGSSRLSVWKRPLPMAGLVFLGTLALAILSGQLLSHLGISDYPLLMGLILSTTSLGVVVPVLKQHAQLRLPFGQLVLIEASLADFVTLVLLAVVFALGRPGPAFELLLIPLLMVIFLISLRTVQRLASQPFLLRLVGEITQATAQIRVRAALAFMVAWVVLAQALGVELILGAFLAGAVAGLLAPSEDSAARFKLEAIGYGFFIPIFFIMVGVQFNLSALSASPSALVLVGLLLVLSYAVKIVPAMALRTLFGARQSLAAGVLVSSRLSLIIAAAAVAVDLGMISDAANSAVILLAVVTTTVSPLLFGRLISPVVPPSRRGIILVGSGHLTEFLARRLSRHTEPVSLILEAGSGGPMTGLEKVRVLGPTAVDAAALDEAGASTARALIDMTQAAPSSLALCQQAREQFDIPLVICLIGEVELATRLRSMGVKVVQPALATAMALEGALFYPTVFDVLVHEAEGVEVGEVIMANPTLAGKKVREVRLPGNALIVSLERETTIMVPHGDTELKLGDRIDLIGSPDAIQQAADSLRG
jgi:Kef-type K+ transport system membrane component KefB